MLVDYIDRLVALLFRSLENTALLIRRLAGSEVVFRVDSGELLNSFSSLLPLSL